MKIGTALKMIRLLHEMQQNELAEKLKVCKSYVSEIETGKKLPTPELLEAYAKVFGLSVSRIFLMSEEESPRTVLNDFMRMLERCRR